MLGQTGANLVGIKPSYDEATSGECGDVVPVVVTVRGDRSFDRRLKTPLTAFLIRKVVGGKGSARPGHAGAGALSTDRLRAIALRELPDLNTTDVDVAMRIIVGTARSMVVVVSD